MAALCATEATVPPAITRRRVGILGFGHLGEYLYTSICTLPEVSARLEIAFVWNRSADKLEGVAEEHRLLDLEEAGSSRWPADVIVEVAHPSITAQYASRLMAAGIDFIVGSPTALADESVEAELRATAASGPRVGGLIIPSGALWGAGDLQALANRSSLAELTVTMKKHPASFRLTDAALDAQRAAAESVAGEVVLYEGPVRSLCPLAPNNVNTMACAALAAHTLGFDGTIGRLVADSRLETHEVEVLALGPLKPNGLRFRCGVQRSSPAPVGAVTSTATYASFLNSLLNSSGRGCGVHFV